MKVKKEEYKERLEQLTDAILKEQRKRFNSEDYALRQAIEMAFTAGYILGEPSAQYNEET